jgi:Flp pilus assembly protein TadG
VVRGGTGSMRSLRTALGKSRDTGQALVELALILPVILLLVVGMLEFARAWNLHQALTDATREAARRAAVQDDDFASQDSAKAAVWRGLSQAGYDPAPAWAGMVTFQYPSGGVWKESGKAITVNVRFPYRFWVLPFRSITMRSTFTMRIE